MTYTLVYTERAARDIRKLDIVARKRLKKALEKLSEDPVQFSTKLINAKIGEYGFRAGDLAGTSTASAPQVYSNAKATASFDPRL